MVPTKLVLVEGLPGSGKSTTAEWLAGESVRRGVSCRWFHELAEDNPIRLGFETASVGYCDHMVEQWTALTDAQRGGTEVLVLESRFWQNTALPMYLSVYSQAEVLAYDVRVRAAIKPLSPVLIWLVEDDAEALLRRLVTTRGQAWVDWIVRRDSQEPWFTSRKLSGFDAWVRFFTDWQALAEKLFAAFDGPKLRAANPAQNWPGCHGAIESFLLS